MHKLSKLQMQSPSLSVTIIHKETSKGGHWNNYIFPVIYTWPDPDARCGIHELPESRHKECQFPQPPLPSFSSYTFSFKKYTIHVYHRSIIHYKKQAVKLSIKASQFCCKGSIMLHHALQRIKQLELYLAMSQFLVGKFVRVIAYF